MEKKLTPTLEARYQDKIQFFAPHSHYETSMDDGIQKFPESAKRSAELGAQAICITDHGTAMGWDDFNAAAQKAKLKPIFGVEFYVKDENTDKNYHLVCYAKDNEGMHQIRHVMSRGEFLEDGRCILLEADLESLKGGHVVITSACISGPFGSVILYNKKIKEKMAKLEAELAEMQSSIDLFNTMSREVETAKTAMAIARSELSEAKKASKTSFEGKKKTLASARKKLERAQTAFDKFVDDGKETSAKSVRTALSALEVQVTDPDDFEEALEKAAVLIQQREAQIAADMANAKAIADEIPNKEKALEEAKAILAAKKSQLETVAKEAAKAQTKQAKIDEFNSQLMSQEAAKEIVDKRLLMLKNIFGKDFYMEMQYHGIPEEKDIFPWEYRMAKKHGIPLVAANDAHMTFKSDADMAIRQIRRSCRFNKWEEIRVGDDELYVKTDRELAEALFQILPESAVIEAMDNIGVICEQCNASIVKESHAPKAKVSNVRDEVMKLARQNITRKYGNEWSQKHEDRLNYEMGIIDSMGFSDYFYITWDILNIARQIGALSYEKLDELKTQMDRMTLDELLAYLDKYGTEINLSVGLGRGSGAGSIVCYLLGITNIDPFKYDLLFEREKDCVH